MKLRTFTATDMPAAMKMVREELGEDAVILSTQTDRMRRQVRVTAAVERASGPPPLESLAPARQERSVQAEWLERLEGVWAFHNTPPALTRKLMHAAQSLEIDALLTLQKLAAHTARGTIEGKILAKILERCFHFSPLPLSEQGASLMLVGPPGIGKTVSVAKLATQLVMDGREVTVITADTKRAGGIEQLQAFTDILNIPLHVAASPAELLALLQKAPTHHVTLVDTAGCNPFHAEEMWEAREYFTLPGAEPVLTLPAGLDANEAADIGKSFAHPAIKRLCITKLDAARRYGSVLAALDSGGYALSHSTNTPRVVGELAALDAPTLAGLLLQHMYSD